MLAIGAAKPPDLILLDIMMPDMDGYEVAGKIKGKSATKNILAIMVTALDDRNARMLASGAPAPRTSQRARGSRRAVCAGEKPVAPQGLRRRT